MITATFEVQLDPARVDEAMPVLHHVLEATRAFPGNEGVEVLVDHDDAAHVTVLERWTAMSDDDAYRAWRAGEGAAPELAEFLVARPKTTRYTPA